MQRVNAKHKTQPWIRDASQDRQPEIHSTPRREDFQRIKEPTNKKTADFGYSFWQIPNTSNICLLEDKIQD